MNIIYLGYNSFKSHKRGVENVIDFQSQSFAFNNIYYIHWGNEVAVYRYKQFICISITNCWYWPLILNLVVSKIKPRGNVLVHAHNALFAIFGLFKIDLLTVHDGLYYLSKSYVNKKSFVFYLMEKILYLKSKNVHFISNFTKDRSLFGERSNYKIIPNSSHLEKFPYKRECLLLNLPSQFTLIVKNIEERARFDLLLTLALKFPNENFIVAGKGPLLEYYRSEIHLQNITNINFLGFVTDEALIHLYSKCSLVINIADYGEGFGLPIIEGYLFDKPVIASNKCAIPEVIISEEFLFENNIDSLAATYEYATHHTGVSFKKYYNRKFSNQSIEEEFREYYKEL